MRRDEEKKQAGEKREEARREEASRGEKSIGEVETERRDPLEDQGPALEIVGSPFRSPLIPAVECEARSGIS